MEKFWRILKGLIIVIGLPAACSYQIYEANAHPTATDNIPLYIISTIIVVAVFAYFINRNSK